MINSSGISADLGVIAPILLIWVTAGIVLMVDLGPGKTNKSYGPVLSILGVLGALVEIVMARKSIVMDINYTAFAGGVKMDNIASVSMTALLVTTLLSILMAWTYLRNRDIEHGEYYVLMLLSVSGAMLMACANDLIVLFLGLEVLSFALYVLAGFARSDRRSEEASVKYFLLGAFASAFLLYGIALVYGAMQTTNLEIINSLLTRGNAPSAMLMAGIGLLIVGLGFKAAVIPFHQWTPDVYEGAPTSVTAYMAGAAKIGAFAAFLRVFESLAPVSAVWLPAIQLIAILTMVIGNILAVTQTNVKRMLAYSSIAHAGYLLVAVAALSRSANTSGGIRIHDLAVNGALFYLFAYTFMTLGAFGVLIYLSTTNKDYQQRSDLRGLARHHPVAAYGMLIFMLSLGGIPPTMGFMGKWQIFMAAVQSGQLTLAIVMALASVAAVYYYLQIVWVMLFEEPVDKLAPEARQSGGARISLVLAAVCTVLFGILPNLLSILLNGGAKP